MDTDNAAPVGRGRGRGGGIAVLPEGMWEGLNRKTEPSHGDDRGDDMEDKPVDFDEMEMQMPPTSFGSRGGRGRGGRGGGRKGGKGYQPDAKGKDWTCPSCSNINWSWRESCNQCAGLKPKAVTADDERRDGVGGGFNERQERASIATVEVAEDGFDDFGRRVKGNKVDRKAKEAAALARLQSSYGFLNAGSSTCPGETSFSELSMQSGGHNVSQRDVTSMQSEKLYNPKKGMGQPGNEVGNRHSPDHNRHREKRREKDRSRERDNGKSRQNERNRSRERSDSRDRERHRYRERSRSREDGSRTRDNSRSPSRGKYRGSGRDRDHYRNTRH